MTLAKRVRDCRYAKGWGPDELASKAEISRTALYQIECGKTELPRAGTLRRIAKALEISIETLLGEPEGGTIDLPSFVKPPTSREPRDSGRVRVANGPRESAFAETIPVESRSNGFHNHRDQELTRKFHELLNTPVGEAVAKVVEESHRLLSSQSLIRSV